MRNESEARKERKRRFLKKARKNFYHCFASGGECGVSAGAAGARSAMESFFASFCSQKEDFLLGFPSCTSA
jgi:hypothetical protein